MNLPGGKQVVTINGQQVLVDSNLMQQARNSGAMSPPTNVNGQSPLMGQNLMGLQQQF